VLIFQRFFLITIVLCSVLCGSQVFAQTQKNDSSLQSSKASKIIQDIRIEGLKRVSDSTVFEILPLDLDDEFNSEGASQTIRELFKTGLFQEVDVFFENNIVFIKVVENASVISISFTRS